MSWKAQFLQRNQIKIALLLVIWNEKDGKGERVCVFERDKDNERDNRKSRELDKKRGLETR